MAALVIILPCKTYSKPCSKVDKPQIQVLHSNEYYLLSLSLSLPPSPILLPAALPDRAMADIKMAYRMPGWYKEMFQGFQHSVEELFPESQPQITPASTSTYIPCCNVHTSLLLTARMSVYACLSVYKKIFVCVFVSLEYVDNFLLFCRSE